MSEHVDVSKIKDPTIAAARKEVEFQRAMNPCPIDFSEFQFTCRKRPLPSCMV